MQSIGNYLKSGREARNIRLSEVARSTKISKWYLDCLEKDEFDKIPGGPYIKGYIASYASFIGIEEDEILKRYDSLQIASADENESQDHLPQDKKRQKSLGLSFRKKYLLILSMAVLILLAFGFTYFFFQNQIKVAAKLQDTQDAKIQPSPSSKIKQVESRLTPNVNSTQSAKLDDFSKNKDATGTDSPALLPSEQNEEGTLQAFLLEENNPKRPDLRHSKNSLSQDTPGIADPYLESVPGYRTSDARSQATNNIRVIRGVAAGGVINKNPEGLSDSFQWSMEKVYIWTMIECEQPPSSIRHTYYFKGQKVNDVELEIKSPQWRTWSYKNLLDKRYIGQWRVDITSDEGELLQSIFFEVN